MKLTYGLIALALSVPAVLAAGTAKAASDCIEIEGSRPSDWCTGQLAALRVAAHNNCSSPRRVGFTYELDHEPIRSKTVGVVPAGDAFARYVMLTLPVSVTAGSHTLTVTVTDASGNVTSYETAVTVESCAERHDLH
jgi:hypothetical protein